MANRQIYITEHDLKRLQELVADLRRMDYHRHDLADLQAEMERAMVVEPEQIPADVITMNSRVRLRDRDSGEEMELTLVFPKDADIDQGRISVQAPVGTALLGYRVGDAIEWKVPSGVARFEVVEMLYQPEAAGDYQV